jgi:acyl dehydratase
MADRDKAHIWDMVEVGDASPPYTFEVTAEKIIDYCRAARYENPVYTNQPAARESGLPGIVAPPAMVFVYAPMRFKELLAAEGVEHLRGQRSLREAPLVDVIVQFHGVMVEPGDVITSVTSVWDKSQSQQDKSITLWVMAHNQRDELVAQYRYTYCWSNDVE